MPLYDDDGYKFDFDKTQKRKQENIEAAKLLAASKDSATPFYRQLDELTSKIDIYQKFFLNRKPEFLRDMDQKANALGLRKRPSQIDSPSKKEEKKIWRGTASKKQI